MGKEYHGVIAKFPDGADTGRLQWEAPTLVFRGTARRVFEGPALAGIHAEAGDLVLADGARFTLGEPFAARWAEAIANPPTLFDKLGVKPGMRVGVSGLDDADFLSGLARITQPVNEFSELDMLFFAADSGGDLERLHSLIPALAPRGALWVVSYKGKVATLKDVEVMAVARPLGLVDTKVCSFSDTRTALRFVRRK
jgi:hypothetical protein